MQSSKHTSCRTRRSALARRLARGDVVEMIDPKRKPSVSSDLGRSAGPRPFGPGRHDSHGDEQVEEERSAAGLHLHLHGAAALEGAAAADDEGEVVGAELGVGRRGVVVGVAGRGQDGAALHARLQALFLQGQALEGGQGVGVGGALFRGGVRASSHGGRDTGGEGDGNARR